MILNAVYCKLDIQEACSDKFTVSVGDFKANGFTFRLQLDDAAPRRDV